MEDQGDVLNAAANDGADQGSDQGSSEEVRANEVPRHDPSGGHWSGRPGAALKEEAWYRITGSYLNNLQTIAIDNFNRANKDDGSFSYSQAFWNGYGCAISGLRDIIREYPVDPTVQ